MCRSVSEKVYYALEAVVVLVRAAATRNLQSALCICLLLLQLVMHLCRGRRSGCPDRFVQRGAVACTSRYQSQLCHHTVTCRVAQVQLGLVDAAYSGDWSRIGVISKGMNPMLNLG